MVSNTFCTAPNICLDDAANGYTSGVEGGCPLGVYCPSDGETDGELCPPSFYCDGTQYTDTLQEDLDQCEVGYYCEEDNVKTACEADLVCYTNSAVSLPCEDGSLANTLGTTCEVCLEGTKCLDGVSVVGDVYKYFDDNVNFPYGKLCPDGTYSNAVGLAASDECTNCT